MGVKSESLKYLGDRDEGAPDRGRPWNRMEELERKLAEALAAKGEALAETGRLAVELSAARRGIADATARREEAELQSCRLAVRNGDLHDRIAADGLVQARLRAELREALAARPALTRLKLRMARVLDGHWLRGRDLEAERDRLGREADRLFAELHGPGPGPCPVDR